MRDRIKTHGLSVDGGAVVATSTERDRKEAFLTAWIDRFKEVGVPEAVARAEFEAAPWDDIKELDPGLAADAAMEVWNVE